MKIKFKIVIGFCIIIFTVLCWVGIKMLLVDPNKCEKVNEVEIDNFSKEHIITITPYRDCNNLGYVYSLKGQISTNIIIDNRLYNKGKIDTLIRDIDYYGGYPISIKVQKKSDAKGYLIIKQKIFGI